MPEFIPSSVHTANVRLRNPTGNFWNYQGELYLGSRAITSGLIAFSIPSNSETVVSFPITMPSLEGTYDVFLDIGSDSFSVAGFQATEPVRVTTPAPLLPPVHADILTMDEYIDMITHAQERLTATQYQAFTALMGMTPEEHYAVEGSPGFSPYTLTDAYKAFYADPLSGGYWWWKVDLELKARILAMPSGISLIEAMALGY